LIDWLVGWLWLNQVTRETYGRVLHYLTESGFERVESDETDYTYEVSHTCPESFLSMYHVRSLTHRTCRPDQHAIVLLPILVCVCVSDIAVVSLRADAVAVIGWL
jgi:hypothetical protein